MGQCLGSSRNFPLFLDFASGVNRSPALVTGDAKISVKPEFGAKELHGVGFHAAPRGTLSHWIVIKEGQIASYQAVASTTRSARPRDEHSFPSPYEASLLGNPVADAERPLEVLRTVPSFDPDGKELILVS